MSESKFRQLPSVGEVLCDDRVGELCEAFSRQIIVALIRRRLAEIRESISRGGEAPSLDELVTLIVTEAHNIGSLSLQPVINATGVILHTNLGRAPLSAEALRAAEIASRGYSNLEFELDSGKRGSRQVHVEQILCQLTGAEAALAVNNNASGVLLALSALARRKEVIISRGQAVEIGGGFRIPEVMRESGAKLVEVGTTNCSYVEDYERVITPRTAALLRVHSSNFKITGFTHGVSLEELVELGRRYNIPVWDDIGSGCLIDTAEFGLEPEPQVQNSISIGAALTFFSGDKLLGGPQAGIILGRRELISKLKKHPLARAVRIDKVRVAALSVTLVHYLKGEALDKIPVLRFIATPLWEVEKRAERWAQFLGKSAAVIPEQSVVGGGSLPGSTLPTRVVAIRLRGKAKIEVLAQRLRQHKPPIVARVEKDALLLDPRSVFSEEEELLLEAVRQALARLERSP
ncbi:MAG TPA: L-seryl-tRNA(Sec) selenium transferase [Chloroflexi bacterium]|nr:L-seryl-tRNA(Sec) selenium transferase [Chloroflexota bacterium]